MTSSGLGFARFITPDLAHTPMRCAEAAAAVATAAALTPPAYSWNDCCLALFGVSPAAASSSLLFANGLLTIICTDTPPEPFVMPLSGVNMQKRRLTPDQWVRLLQLHQDMPI